MTFDLIVRGGTLVTSGGEIRGDLGVRDGRIAEIGDLAAREAAQVLDADGLHVLPGVIDTQVHFREPGLEHKEDIESGSRAAICGGVTTFFEMPNTQPPTTTREALEDKLTRAEGRAWSDFAFFVGASPDNARQLGELELLPGTPGVKIFMGSSTGSLLVDDEDVLREVLRHGKRPCPVHAEDEARLRERKGLAGDRPDVGMHPFLRDPEAARLATERLIRLCEETGRPVHVLHVSTADELPMLLEAKQRGLPVTCEITPQHLSFEAPECYEKLGSRAQMNPPLRAKEHRQGLWLAFKHGLFDVIGSDHAPHTIEEKSRPYPLSPSGMPGVQTLLPVMLDWVNRGEVELAKVVRMTSEAPAHLYGIKNKGRIAEGFDADLAIIDLRKEFEVTPRWLQSKCGWSPFEGMRLRGYPAHTVLRGEVIVREGELIGKPGGRAVEFSWKD